MDQISPKNEAPPVDARFQRWVNDSRFKASGSDRYTGATKDLSTTTEVASRLDRKLMKGLLKQSEA